MLDFESAMEDHFLDVTHIIRGKDLMKTADKQRYVYEYLGWEYPTRPPLGPGTAAGLRQVLHQRDEEGHRGRRVHRLGRPAAADRGSAQAPGPGAGGDQERHGQHGRDGDGHRVQHGHALRGEPEDRGPEGEQVLLRPRPGGAAHQQCASDVAKAPLHPQDPKRGYQGDTGTGEPGDTRSPVGRPGQ